jgi:Cu(I)/Ag(I) efflux system protein CusF
MNALAKLAIATVFAFSAAATAVAQESGHAAQGAPDARAGQVAHSAQQGVVRGQMVDGEVKKVDKEAAKITIRHGELKDLGMPAMTMAFRTKEPAMLDQVKVGDKVKFVAEKVNGAIMLVQLENAK